MNINAEITGILLTIINIFITLQRKFLENCFTKSNAYDSNHAIKIEKPNYVKSKLLNWMIKSGTVVQIKDKYYMNKQKIEKSKALKKKRAKIIIPIVVVLLVLIIVFYI